jgi:hypothetical protein
MVYPYFFSPNIYVFKSKHTRRARAESLWTHHIEIERQENQSLKKSTRDPDNPESKLGRVSKRTIQMKA